LKGLSKNGVNCGEVYGVGNGLQSIINLGKLKGPEKMLQITGKYKLREPKSGVLLYVMLF
jgi:hypothetical protein